MMPTPIFSAVTPWLTTWLTSLWLIGVGALLGILALLLIWGLTFIVNREAAKQVPLAITEGVLLPITSIVAIVAIFGLVGAIFARNPLTILESLQRLPNAGEKSVVAEIPASVEASSGESTATPVQVDLYGDELIELSLSSNRLVSVADAAEEKDRREDPLEIDPSDPYEWSKSRQGGIPFGGDFVGKLYVSNPSDETATITIASKSAPAYPQVTVIPTTAIGVLGIYILYFLQAWCFPRVSAIALATSKSEVAQPIFGIIVAVGVFMLLLFEFLPYNTFGEDIKMLKDSGLTLIMVLAIIQGVWAASNSVSEEIEGRTALTVLSKPIGRRQFIIGKVLGILWTVALLFIILGVLFLIVVAYKPVYDARELGSETPSWELVHTEVVRTVPGLVLAFFETVVLVTLSVAISTRLPMLANFVICFSVYVLGHLTPLIVQAPIDFPPVVFIGQLIATILPVLDHFNIQAAVAAGRPVPLEYLLMAFFYCVLYSLIALLLSLALFEDRDLA
ncbi:MAG: ABC transporter permease [Pirellulaceae bacterium]|nr:ABC transporter permease [Pirellulaceae bacterium]